MPPTMHTSGRTYWTAFLLSAISKSQSEVNRSPVAIGIFYLVGHVRHLIDVVRRYGVFVEIGVELLDAQAELDRFGGR